MTRIAVVGANGQVGAELCLLLRAMADVELVPVCRNRSGSAFLRWQGLACRHGRIADPADAPRLIGDCDVVVNSSLASGNPAQIRGVEDAIAGNIVAHAKAGCRVIHFSTQSVYGDPEAGRRIRWRNPYGRAKLGTERAVRSAARRYGKPVFILRLGHVCGELQEITKSIRAQIQSGAVPFPSREHTSNTVYTAAIVHAILQIARGSTAAGTYDLMNSPPWSWREVYEHEARRCGVPLQLREVPAPSAPARRWLPAVLGSARRLAMITPVRDAAAKLFAHAPRRLNERAMAWWYVRRTGAEIAAIHPEERPASHLSWVANGSRFFPAATPTIGLLNAAAAATGARAPWPADLPDAGIVSYSVQAAAAAPTP